MSSFSFEFTECYQNESGLNKGYKRALKEAVACYKPYGEWSHPTASQTPTVAHMSPSIYFEGMDMEKKYTEYKWVARQLLINYPYEWFIWSIQGRNNPLEFDTTPWYPERVKCLPIITDDNHYRCLAPRAS